MLKKILKIVAVVLVVALIGIQFVRPARTNPPVDPKMTIEASVNVPDKVEKILKRSCNDCHSNKTVWPWYSNVAPISWQVIDHVNEGRKELNFSVWGTYKDRRKNRKLKEVCEQVENEEMPHPQYLWIHRDAALTKDEILTVCDWAKGLMQQAAQEDNKQTEAQKAPQKDPSEEAKGGDDH